MMRPITLYGRDIGLKRFPVFLFKYQNPLRPKALTPHLPAVKPAQPLRRIVYGRP
jgi:hypothetical protein